MLDEEDVSWQGPLIEEYSSYAHQRPRNRFCHEREVSALPERFHDRLPHRARLAYLSDVYYDLDLEAYCTSIASNPRKLKRGKALRLTLDEANTFCRLLSTVDAPQYVIRCAPAYFLSLSDQRKLSVENRSFVYPQPISIPQPRKKATARPPVERETAAFEAVNRNKSKDGNQAALLFDVFYFLCLNQYTYNNRGERLQLVEASAFADRLTGRRTGRVKRVWLTERQIHQALLWSHDLDKVDGYTRWLRVNTYVLQQGALAPTLKELTDRCEPKQYTTFFALSRQVLLPPEDYKSETTSGVLKAVDRVLWRYQARPEELKKTMAFLRRKHNLSKKAQKERGEGQEYDQYSDLLLSEDEVDQIQYWVHRVQDWYSSLPKGKKEPCLVTHAVNEIVDGEINCLGYSVLIGIPTTFRDIPYTGLIVRPKPKPIRKALTIKKDPLRNFVADIA